MKDENRSSKRRGKARYEDVYNSLRRTDRAVLKYLDRLTERGKGNTCKTTNRRIASACEISERQVQISTGRLIDAGLLKRLNYDFANPDLAKRGTIYKVLGYRSKKKRLMPRERKSIKLLLFWSED
jgi:hypothetical protein